MLKKGPKRDQFFEKVPFRDHFPEKDRLVNTAATQAHTHKNTNTHTHFFYFLLISITPSIKYWRLRYQPADNAEMVHNAYYMGAPFLYGMSGLLTRIDANTHTHTHTHTW